MIAAFFLTFFPSDLCLSARAAAPNLQACADAPNGAAVSTTSEIAARTIAAAQTAEVLFEQRFGRGVPTYVYIHSQTAPDWAAFESVGFKTVVYFPSVDMAVESYAQQLKLGESGQREEDVANQVQSMRTLLTRVEASTVAHELGHDWFRTVFWADSALPLDGYGTAAPDWLDEGAALLMEADAVAEERRRIFWWLWRRTPEPQRGAGGAIGDLGALLEQRHPTLASKPEEGGGVSKDRYYAEARMFMDYLVDRLPSPSLETLAVALSEGRTLDQWLGSVGGDFPQNREALIADWRDWLRQASAGQ